MLTKEITEFCTRISQTGRIFSLDLGTKYIGIANSNIEQEFAFPNSVFKRKNLEFDLNFLTDFVIEKEAVGMIIGLPEEGKMVKIVNSFSQKLSEKIDEKFDFDFPIFLYNECMTSRLANEMFFDENLSLKKNIAKNDQIAAYILLQEVLEYKNRMMNN